MVLLQRGAAQNFHNPTGMYTQRTTLQQPSASTAKGTQSLFIRVQHAHNPQAPWRAPTARRPPALSPPSRGKNCELTEEGRTALALRYALALPLGHERLRTGVGLKLAKEFGVGEIAYTGVGAR